MKRRCRVQRTQLGSTLIVQWHQIDRASGNVSRQLTIKGNIKRRRNRKTIQIVNGIVDRVVIRVDITRRRQRSDVFARSIIQSAIHIGGIDGGAIGISRVGFEQKIDI